MPTYNLFPGLKQILEDKRIRRWGVPEREYEDYLKAEQFAIDLRFITREDVKELDLTYDSLAEMGLDKLPYEKVVVHVLSKVTKNGGEVHRIITCFMSHFFHGPNKVDGYYLYDSPEKLSANSEAFLSDQNNRDKFANYLRTMKRSLIVLLATRNIIKERHDGKKSQVPINGSPHKKGSAAYTLLRAPDANEIGEGIGTHASPRPHLRRGHIRKLHPDDKTRWILVSPCFVNGEPDVMRKAYVA